MLVGDKVYEGRTKILYNTADPDLYRLYFKDEATAFGKRRGAIAEKGVYNAQISTILFTLLSEAGIPNHYREKIGERVLLVKKLVMYPLIIVVRNAVAGSLAPRLGLEEGFQLLEPVVEYYYKREGADNPLLNESHLNTLGFISAGRLQTCSILALQTNLLLRNYFAHRGLLLVDFKLEFGLADEKVFLGDEISPDTCRLWDVGTGEKLDKDRFRWDMGGVEEAYREVVERLLGQV
ncbi:MAG: phosphoribosylaminoimidazolesuccinocarboxamide synthase [Firmicutes bacterium]|nr:phosphoribosylaminoimidazolesuccinocarboxamide synthase [Bacillota bacterium]